MCASDCYLISVYLLNMSSAIGIANPRRLAISRRSSPSPWSLLLPVAFSSLISYYYIITLPPSAYYQQDICLAILLSYSFHSLHLTFADSYHPLLLFRAHRFNSRDYESLAHLTPPRCPPFDVPSLSPQLYITSSQLTSPYSWAPRAALPLQ